jgi:replicative DNA helicase
MPTSPERLLLSSVLRQGDLKVAIAHGVTGEMFHDYNAEWLWLEDYFRRFKKVPSKATFVGKFPDFRIINADDTIYLTEEVKQHHVKTVLVEQMQEIAESISEGDVDSAVRMMNASIVKVSGSIGTMGDSDIFTDFKDVLAEVESRHERAKQSGASGIPFGFPTLDDLTGGAQPGELIIVGARLGQGKSWVLQKMAANAASHGHTVVFNALEQTRAQVATRIHALVSGGSKEVFNSNHLMRGENFDIRAYRKFLRDLKLSMPGSLHVSDASRGRVSPMTCASQIERHNPDVLYVDYLTLMQKSGPDWQGISELSGDMAQLGARYQIPVICAAQLNREHGLGRDPAGPEAIAQSDSIGQDASLVITQRQWSKHVLACRVAKYRNGEGDARFYIEFRPGDGIIREVSFNKAQEIIDADKDAQAAVDDKASA